MKKIPSSTLTQPNLFLSSGVHKDELSDQSPVHSPEPQGFLSLQSLTFLPCAIISLTPTKV